MSQRLKNSSSILQKIKQKAKAAVSISGRIVQIPSDVKGFACVNTDYHKAPNGKAIKYILSFNPRDKELVCQCGIVYKRV